MNIYKLLSLLGLFTMLILNACGSTSKSINYSEIKTTIGQIDTLTLGEFEAEKVVRYSIQNARICIAAQDYIESMEVRHERFKYMADHAKEDDIRYDVIKNGFRVIDSVLKSVKEQMGSKDTIDVYYQVFEEVGLGVLIRISELIENSQCAVYDENGIRQYKIIRKYESFYVAPLFGWGGRRYYLMSKDKYFFEVTDRES